MNIRLTVATALTAFAVGALPFAGSAQAADIGDTGRVRVVCLLAGVQAVQSGVTGKNHGAWNQIVPGVIRAGLCMESMQGFPARLMENTSVFVDYEGTTMDIWRIETRPSMGVPMYTWLARGEETKEK